MIVIAGLILGIIVGILRAKARGGNGKDMAQPAAVYAILFAIIGLFITIIIHRLAG
jgi:prolipoprotein diacylglyceryltransferase